MDLSAQASASSHFSSLAYWLATVSLRFQSVGLAAMASSILARISASTFGTSTVKGTRNLSQRILTCAEFGVTFGISKESHSLLSAAICGFAFTRSTFFFSLEIKLPHWPGALLKIIVHSSLPGMVC